MKRFNSWSEQEINYLTDNYGKLSYGQIAKQIGRTPFAVKAKCKVLSFRTIVKRPVQVNEVFERLTVLAKTGKKTKNKNNIFLCQCSCGNTTEVPGRQLRSGNTRSCGCYAIFRNQETTRRAPGTISWTKLFTRYKNGAKLRKLSFRLTFDQFNKLAVQTCYYCGTKPQPYNAYIKKNKKDLGYYSKTQESTIDRAWIKANGIDRIDSNIGYIIENCVTSCSICNYAKKNMSQDNFLKWIDGLVQFKTTGVNNG